MLKKLKKYKLILKIMFKTNKNKHNMKIYKKNLMNSNRK